MQTETEESGLGRLKATMTENDLILQDRSGVIRDTIKKFGEERKMEINKVYQGSALDMIGKIPEGYTPVLVTDPPFNIGYHYEGYSDNMDESDYYSMLAKLIEAVGGKAVIVHYPEALHKLSIKLGVAPKRVVSWVYNSNTRRQHRDIAYYGFSPKMSQVVQPYKNPTDKRIMERISRGIVGGGIIRLVQSQSGQERVFCQEEASLPNAASSHAQCSGRDTRQREGSHRRSVLRYRHNACRGA